MFCRHSTHVPVSRRMSTFTGYRYPDAGKASQAGSSFPRAVSPVIYAIGVFLPRGRPARTAQILWQNIKKDRVSTHMCNKLKLRSESRDTPIILLPRPGILPIRKSEFRASAHSDFRSGSQKHAAVINSSTHYTTVITKILGAVHISKDSSRKRSTV